MLKYSLQSPNASKYWQSILTLAMHIKDARKNRSNAPLMIIPSSQGNYEL